MLLQYIGESAMIKVAMIDSGIEYNKAIFEKCVVDGISIAKNCDGKIFISKDYIDENGHGTLCASVLYRECPEVKLFVIKIFQKELSVDIDILERALEYLLEIDVQIISMSISLIDCNKKENRIKKVCDKLQQQKKILISAVTNGKKRSKPAEYREVIGVRGAVLENNDEVWFSNLKRINSIIDDVPYLHYRGNGKYSLFGMCNSYATAKLSGKIARDMYENENISIRQIRKNLMKESRYKLWIEEQIKRSKRYPIFKDKSIVYEACKMRRLEGVLQSFFDLDSKEDLYTYALYSKRIGNGMWYYHTLAQVLEKEYMFKFETYSEISKFDFVSIFSIYKLLKEKLLW